MQALVLEGRKKALKSGGTWRSTSALASRVCSFRSSISVALSNLTPNAAIVITVVKRGRRKETSVCDCRNSEHKSRFHSSSPGRYYANGAGADSEKGLVAWKPAGGLTF